GGDAEASKAYAWGDEPSIDDERAALRAVLIDMPHIMKNPDVWFALLGQHGRAMTPSAPRSPLALYGSNNSGKTFVATAAGGMMGADLVREDEVQNFKATRVAVEMIARQFTE